MAIVNKKFSHFLTKTFDNSHNYLYLNKNNSKLFIFLTI